MELGKRSRLQAAGCKVGGAADFLALSPKDALLVDIRARLASALAARHANKQITQTELARRIQSSQPVPRS